MYDTILVPTDGSEHAVRAAGEWRWRLVASNGKIIADSGEGYQSKQGVERGIESVRRSAPDAEMRYQDDS